MVSKIKSEKDLNHRSLVKLILIISILTSLLVSSLFLINELKNLDRISKREQESFVQFSNMIGIHVGRLDYATAGLLAKQFANLNFVRDMLILDEYDFPVFGNKDRLIKMRAKAVDQFNVFSQPLNFVKNGTSNAVGKIVILHPKADYSAIFRIAAAQVILLFCLVFFPSYGVLTYYIRRFVLEPVKHLSDAINETVETGEPVKSEYSSDSHMGQLAHNFDAMQMQLHQANTRVKQTQLSQKIQFDGVSKVLSAARIAVCYFDAAKNRVYQSDNKFWPPAFRRLLLRPVPDLKEAMEILSEDGATVIPVVSASTIPSVTAYTLNVESTDGEFWLIAALQLSKGGFGYHVSNVSDLRRMETELSQAKKMEAVGVLTSGIAHEFNNYLAVISGNLELILAGNKVSDDQNKKLSRVTSTVSMATDTVRQLLQYSRQDPNSDESGVEINGIIENVNEKAIVFLEDSATLSCVSDKNFFFLVNGTGLESALINFVKNAAEAAEGTANISIVSREMTNLEREKWISDHPNDDYAVVEVIDDGPHIPKAKQAKLFDPFFTSKPVGEGVGLGLWTVHRFAQQVGGEVIYSQAEPTGNKFSLILPIAVNNLSETTKHWAPPKKGQLAGKSVLLVEDEDFLFDVTFEFLEQSGAEVYGARTIGDAHEILAEQELDIAICDLHLPDGLGTEICSMAKSGGADILTVVLSGNLSMSDQDKTQVDVFVQKPVQYSEFFDLLAGHSAELAQKKMFEQKMIVNV